MTTTIKTNTLAKAMKLNAKANRNGFGCTIRKRLFGGYIVKITAMGGIREDQLAKMHW